MKLLSIVIFCSFDVKRIDTIWPCIETPQGLEIGTKNFKIRGFKRALWWNIIDQILFVSSFKLCNEYTDSHL